MKDKNNSRLLRIMASSTDKIKSRPWYEHVVVEARKNNMAGATVFKGIIGYGGSSEIHTAKFLELTEKIPVSVEVIDKKKKIIQFYQMIENDLINMGKGCIVIQQKVEVMMYREGGKEAGKL